jgi:serine/threonine protein kinase
VQGTNFYIDPEVLNQSTHSSAKTDLYALGATILVMIVRKSPSQRSIIGEYREKVERSEIFKDLRQLLFFMIAPIAHRATLDDILPLANHRLTSLSNQSSSLIVTKFERDIINRNKEVEAESLRNRPIVNPSNSTHSVSFKLPSTQNPPQVDDEAEERERINEMYQWLKDKPKIRPTIAKRYATELFTFNLSTIERITDAIIDNNERIVNLFDELDMKDIKRCLGISEVC